MLSKTDAKAYSKEYGHGSLSILSLSHGISCQQMGHTTTSRMADDKGDDGTPKSEHQARRHHGTNNIH